MRLGTSIEIVELQLEGKSGLPPLTLFALSPLPAKSSAFNTHDFSGNRRQLIQ